MQPTRLGVIGLGTMGAGMANNLQQKGGFKITVTDQQPRFSYASALLTVDNRDVANFPAIHNAGTATGCTASPALPAGLSLAANCNISGSPTAASELAEYTITATNSGGSYAQIIEIVQHVALNTWTNYINEVAQTEIDFPLVEALDATRETTP